MSPLFGARHAAVFWARRKVPVRRASLAVLLVVIFSTLLISTEAFAFAGALVWALAGLLHLPFVVTVVLGGVAGLAAAWVSFQILRLAYDSELDLQHEAAAESETGPQA